MKARIYVSAMEDGHPGAPVFDDQALSLLDQLKHAGYDVRWTKEWRRYDIIEQEIADCDALLAVPDFAWTCSTWMAIEVAAALGRVEPESPSALPIKPLPVLVYPVYPREKWGWLRGEKGLIELSRDVAQAVPQIDATLSHHLLASA